MEIKSDNIILVTGGTGLVGKAIQYVVENGEQHKNEKWIFASSKDADLTSLESTKAMFDKYKPTHVIHLAAKVGGLFGNLQVSVCIYSNCISNNRNKLYL